MVKRTLSRPIQRELAAIAADRIVVAAVKTVASSDSAILQAWGLLPFGDAVAPVEPAPPRRELGLYARRNLDGWRERHTNRPLEDREISHWAPNWHGSGTHLVSRTIKAYPIEHHPARLLTVSATVLEQLAGGALVRLRVDHPLQRAAPNFVSDLQFNLSLLREVCGEAHVFDADMSDEDYARIQRVDWELLPPGSLERVINGLKVRSPSDPGRVLVAEERLRALDRLKPDELISGTGKFSSYFGAKFGENLVALENLEYGNALYLFEADWERLTQLTRTELVKRRDEAVHRVPHATGWQSIVRKLIRKGSR